MLNRSMATMSLTALQLSSSSNGCFPAPTTAALRLSNTSSTRRRRRHVHVPRSVTVGVRATAANSGDEEVEEVEEEEGGGGVEASKSEQSLLEALDFSQVRSAEDGKLLDEARETTGSGKQMSREQYGALRRKIGGTYQDFFKSYVEVEGDYVEEGWVDKTCKVCKKDTSGEERQVDRFGKYVHVACLQKSKPTNFFSNFFS